jgi:Predicted metal-binding integral membrane protein (DUF2182)
MVDQVNDRLTDRGATQTPLSAAMTSAGTAATATALTMLGLAAASWLVAVRQMNGMDMGVATDLGSFQLFVAVWASMMAAMMLPGAAPAASRHAHASGRMRAAPLFVASYLAVWLFVGVAVYAAYQPHGTTAAGVMTIAAGVYELTPLKQHFRRRCRERPLRSRVRSQLRRLEHRTDADDGGAGANELHLDVRGRRPRARPEAHAAASIHRRAARSDDHRHRNPRRRRAVVDSRSHPRHVVTGRSERK